MTNDISGRLTVSPTTPLLANLALISDELARAMAPTSSESIISQCENVVSRTQAAGIRAAIAGAYLDAGTIRPELDLEDLCSELESAAIALVQLRNSFKSRMVT